MLIIITLDFSLGVFFCTWMYRTADSYTEEATANANPALTISQERQKGAEGADILETDRAIRRDHQLSPSHKCCHWCFSCINDVPLRSTSTLTSLRWCFWKSCVWKVWVCHKDRQGQKTHFMYQDVDRLLADKVKTTIFVANDRQQQKILAKHWSDVCGT